MKPFSLTQFLHPALTTAVVAIHLFGSFALRGAGFEDRSKLLELDRLIETAVADATVPGAVIWLESGDDVYFKAYGRRVVSPGSERMARDTVFDLASLTKVVATTPAILKLVEERKVDLDAPLVEYIPEFISGGTREGAETTGVTAADRGRIKIVDLLTHQSGLPPGIFRSEKDFWGHEEGIRRAIEIGMIEPPGTRFRYSDVNFILLGEVVRRASGQRIDSYVEDHFYGPLGMNETGYCPPAFRTPRIAPTNELPGYGLIRGEVHDPTARRMEGIAGHAGVFSTAEDLAKFTRFFLRKTTVNDPLILGADTIAMATREQNNPLLQSPRGLGWDIGSAFSYQRGEKFPRAGYGHTGWTGTSIWVDPASETFVILLTNRNHPNEGISVKKLRIDVGTLAAGTVGYTTPVPLSKGAPTTDDTLGRALAADPGAAVYNGIDVLEKEKFARLAGLQIGLITNQTGISRLRRSTIDLLANAPDVELAALFSPEHGIRGEVEAGATIDDDYDAATGLRVYSLYKSESRAPTPAQLEGLDALVFDIQDIGCRYYTYISTMGLAMEAASKAGIRFIVLDRVNPIGGLLVDGPIRSGKGNDFVAFHDIPVQHGMTVGELARMFAKERKLKVDLTIVTVEGWSAAMRHDETGLPWVNPSPNIRSLTQALLYPGIGLTEFTNISVGRGTATPFEHVGAPWINDGKLAAALQKEALPGVFFTPTQFTPESSVYEGEDCGGVRFFITDRDALRSVDVGITVMKAIHELYPQTFDLAENGNVLLRHEPTLKRILKGKSLKDIHKSWQPEVDRFLKRRKEFLLYPR